MKLKPIINVKEELLTRAEDELVYQIKENVEAAMASIRFAKSYLALNEYRNPRYLQFSRSGSDENKKRSRDHYFHAQKRMAAARKMLERLSTESGNQEVRTEALKAAARAESIEKRLELKAVSNIDVPTSEKYL